MLPQPDLRALLSSADLFICPSVYEPLGIVNLEAMACETAVLATRVGGIPEVVVDGKTGELVDYNGDGVVLESALAERISQLMSDPDKLVQYGKAGRKRAVEDFGWDAIADQTETLYRTVIKNR